MATLRKLHTLDRTQWRYIMVAIIQLARARIELARQSALEIATPSGPSHATMPSAYTLDLDRVSWAITATASRVPWRSDCLVQAMAARRWLEAHGLSSQLRLGVGKDETGAMRAHAWLLHDGHPITGGPFEADERFAKLPPLDER